MQNPRKNTLLYAMLLVALPAKLILATYGVKYQVHVDEWIIIKDPLKILMQYQSGNFSTSTNFYNFILTFWHGCTFLFGLICGWWDGLTSFGDSLSLNDTRILMSFRVLCVLLATVGLYLWLKLIDAIFNNDVRWKILAFLIFLFNPIELNSCNWVKFDAICFLLYALQMGAGYRYFIGNQKELRMRMYLLVFVATATRIENIAFLLGFLMWDFAAVHRWSFREFFSRTFLKAMLGGVCLYLIFTLNFVHFFAPPVTGATLTTTKTFEEVITSLIDFSSMSYTFYLMCALALLGPVVLALFPLHFIRMNTTGRTKLFFLLFPLLILSAGLALDQVKNVFYFLGSSCLILFVVLYEMDAWKNNLLRTCMAAFVLIWFVSYDVSLVVNAMAEPPNTAVSEWIKENTRTDDTIVYDGSIELSIEQNPSITREKLATMAFTGGGTGLGLGNQLKSVTTDSSNTRYIFSHVEDYFWKGTEWENKWLLGNDTIRLSQVNANVIVVARKEFDPAVEDPSFTHYLDAHYKVAEELEFSFIDPRMYYRTYYYFHSFRVYQRK